MNFQQAKDSLLITLFGVAVAILAWMANSVNELNINVAKVVATVEQHEVRIQRLEN